MNDAEIHAEHRWRFVRMVCSWPRPLTRRAAGSYSKSMRRTVVFLHSPSVLESSSGRERYWATYTNQSTEGLRSAAEQSWHTPPACTIEPSVLSSGYNNEIFGDNISLPSTSADTHTQGLGSQGEQVSIEPGRSQLLTMD